MLSNNAYRAARHFIPEENCRTFWPATNRHYSGAKKKIKVNPKSAKLSLRRFQFMETRIFWDNEGLDTSGFLD